MTSTSAIVNRALRMHVAPVLREAGFTRVDARNGWRWLGKTVWVVNVRAVGSYFSDVTGWPPGSVGVWLGVYYSFMPMDYPIKVDREGRLLPAEHLCQMRTHLECSLDQSQRLEQLRHAAERRRKDLWWIDPDGSNAPAAAADIASALKGPGLQWFERHSNLMAVLVEVERSEDCFVKFDVAALLARELGDGAKLLQYAERAAAEGRRIQRPIDRQDRYGV